VTISADAYNAGIGWDSCGTLGLNLVAFNTRFFGQPDKGGTVGAYSTLLVDGKNTPGSAAKFLGKPEVYEPAQDGGYAIADGGAVYTGLGCELAKRHLLVKFAADKSEAWLSTLDRIKSAAQHTYTWQGNLGDQNTDDGIVATSGQEAGRAMFLLKGHNNGFVKGWVVHPAEAKVSFVETRVTPRKAQPPGDKTPAAQTGMARDPLQITVKSGHADIWVVMWVGQGAPPEATVAGSGLDSVLSVPGRKVRFDGEANRVKAE
jgi:hypothetical protein